MTFGIGPPGREQENRVWAGEREYRVCKLGETVGLLLKFVYHGELSAIALVWVLENSDDRIEMTEYPRGLSGTGGELNIGFGGVVPEHAIPGRYNLETLRVHYKDSRRPPTNFEPPKVGILVTEERVETPQLQGFEFE